MLLRKIQYNPEIKDEIGIIFNKIRFFVRGNIIHHYCKFFNITPKDIKYPLLPKFIIKKRWKRMMNEIIKLGITSITEAGLGSWKEFEILNEIYQEGNLRVRVNIIFASRLLDEVIKRGYRTGYGNEWIRITGMKFYADGWLGSRTAAMMEPYDDIKTNGILFLDYKKAYPLVRKAYENGLRVTTHTIGDLAVSTMIKVYKDVLKLDETSRNIDHRFSIEHATLVPTIGIDGKNPREDMKENKITASIQFSFAATDCTGIQKAIGVKRSENWNIFRTLYDMGVPCTGGSDFNLADLSPMWGIQRVITRADVDGDPVGCNRSEILEIEQALELLTLQGAYHSFEEDIKGSIEVGKLADLVILSEDIIEMGKNNRCRKCIHNVKVEITIIDGKIEYLNPKSTLYPFKKNIKKISTKNPLIYSSYTIIHGFA